MPLNAPIESWEDRRCWIVGASTGIGAALAAELVSRGARVALSARRASLLEDQVARFGPERAMALPLDIRDAPALEAAARSIVERWDGLDVLVLMAGDYQPTRAWALDAAAAKATVETNLVGYFNALAAVLPHLVDRGAGTVVIVSSVAGYRGLPKSLVYGATKAALINMAETLYLDLHGKGIGVAVVNPGFVRTPLTAGNDFEMPALIEPAEAAREIVAGLARGAFEIHFPKRFTGWLKLLRLLPYGLYFPAIRRFTGAR